MNCLVSEPNRIKYKIFRFENRTKEIQKHPKFVMRMTIAMYGNTIYVSYIIKKISLKCRSSCYLLF